MPDYLRIPVTGPAPYNTLAVVHHFEFVAFVPPSDDSYYKTQLVVKSHFRLQGFDQRIQYPSPEHSTTVNLTHLSTDRDPSWLVAIDAVDGFFSDDDGTWCVRFDFASKKDAALGATFDLCSWVLCYETPLSADAGRVSPRSVEWASETLRPTRRALIPAEPSLVEGAAERALGSSVPRSRSKERGPTAKRAVARAARAPVQKASAPRSEPTPRTTAKKSR